jgi:Helix-turn-helix family
MTPEQAAHDTKAAVVSVPARFMTDAATYARGAELGFQGADFYFAGRGGVLGDTPADVVAAAMVFFAPETVRDAWERSSHVLPRRQTAEEWAQCAHVYAASNLPSSGDDARLAELLGTIVEHASPALAPLFAGWRSLPTPSGIKELVIHRLNALRELRGGLHAAAVTTVGLTPLEAIAVRAPRVAAIAGWTSPLPEVEPVQDRWTLAESRTDRMLGRHFAILDTDELAELVDLLGALNAT